MSERGFADVVIDVPARREATFARVERGGTGRFDLVVVFPDGSTELVRPTLSRYQAEEAAKVINAAFAAWFPVVVA